MPSQSEGWGGLSKDESTDYYKERFASMHKEPLRGIPSLLRQTHLDDCADSEA